MKKFWKIFVAILLVIVLIVGLCVILYHQSGWLFSMVRQAQEHEPLALTPTKPFDATETQTMTEWLQDTRVKTDKTLMLVNLNNPLPNDYQADLEEYNGAKMHPLMVESYIALRDAVQEKTGIRIYVSSDFRTAEKQAELLEFYGPDRAAPVGCSEHEAGLSLDVYAPGHDSYKFLKSPAGRMVNRICHEYGFIIRYEADKTEITGFDYEPWHLRYVGAPHAELIANSGLAYEEYINAITPETWYSYNNYLILRTANVEEITLPTSFTACHISPDNTGYYIITVKL
ncbi:MAG: D-alanyl-D-alanine carboxypeptidase family protein [Ruminococcaceae bacterium]|nr:D-alanyl-D-alanine carboxypeptidase family protein [Oscillospiraceae bacterium]